MSGDQVKVFCRFRPETENEAELGSSCVELTTGRHPGDGAVVDLLTPGGGPGGMAVALDGAFGPRSSQLELYEEVGHPLLQQLTSGYNAAILSYGQTGTGKTYTMLGDADNLKLPHHMWDMGRAGLIPYSMVRFCVLRAQIPACCFRPTHTVPTTSTRRRGQRGWHCWHSGRTRWRATRRTHGADTGMGTRL